MYKLSIKSNLKAPKELNFQDDLLYIANNIIIREIQTKMVQQQSIDAINYPPLAESTLRAKQRKGLSPNILEATGQLGKSFFAKKLGKSKVLIGIRFIRADIARYLQIEGIRSKKYGKRFFNFFGINTFAEKLAINYMVNKIKKRVRFPNA